MSARADIWHKQFCPALSGATCSCWGVPDRRQLISWDRAIRLWGEDGVALMTKTKMLESVQNAAFFYLEDEVFSS